MTISSISYTPQTYSGAGAGPYQFTFECLAETVFVLIDGEVSPIEFFVTLNGEGPIFQGGSVTFLQSIPSSSIITIGRSTQQDQGVDYQTYTRFPAETHEFALDKLTLIAQEAIAGEGGSGPAPGNFLPLAGGTMNPEASIGWQNSQGGTARMLMTTLLGVGAFVVQPLAGAQDMGYVFQIDDALTKYMAASVDGVWALEGRPDFASLPDNAIATKADVTTGGGQFLPLAGGPMDPGAVVTFTESGDVNSGELTYDNFLTVPSWILQPAAGSADNGFLFGIDTALTKTLAGSVDGVWAITGRPAFSGLADNALAIKEDVADRISRAGDTWDVGVTQVFPKDPTATQTSDAEMAWINFFGINALRIQAATANTSLGLGYLFLTDQQNIATPFMVGSKTDGWRIRNQLFDDPDDIITVEYLQQNAVGDAPEDGTEYVRKDGFWVPNTGGSGGEANTASSAGAGESLVLPKAGVDLPFKSLVAGTDVTLTPGADTITINFTGGGAGVAWGTITGSLSAQTDLQGALDAKISTAGDTWLADATQDFTTPSALPAFSGGTMGFVNFLGLPGWVWQPQSGGGTEQVGFLWDTTTGGTGPAMGGNPTDGFEIRDQVLASGESIITRALGDARFAAISHTHPISQITGLQTELNSLQSQINTKAPSSAINTATWGQIVGTLSNQSDLQFALNSKFNTSGGSISGQVTIGGGTSGGLIVTGTGAGFGIDSTGIIFGRAGFNANNQKLVALAAGTSGTDAVNVTQLNTKLDVSVAASTYAALAQNETITGIYTFQSGFSASAGVSLAGGALMGSSRIQGLANGINPNDAVNLSQVQALIAAATA